MFNDLCQDNSIGRSQDDEVQELCAAYEACRDGAERTRLQAVRLYGIGRVVTEITEIAQFSRRSLARWRQE